MSNLTKAYHATGHFHWFLGASAISGSHGRHTNMFCARFSSRWACKMTSSICPQLILDSTFDTSGSWRKRYHKNDVLFKGVTSCLKNVANLKNMFVCCLLTQNFQAGSVGRIFFLLPVQEKDIILGKTVINRSKKKNCFSKMAKK